MQGVKRSQNSVKPSLHHPKPLTPIRSMGRCPVSSNPLLEFQHHLPAFTLVVSTFLVAIALALASPLWDLVVLARRVPHEMTKLAINSLSISPAIHSRTQPSDRQEHIVHHAHSDASLIIE
jgi:hypothetical protein